jgi:hypothetical protein
LSLEFQAKVQTCVNDNVSPDNCCKSNSLTHLSLVNLSHSVLLSVSALGFCEPTNQCTLFKKWPLPVPLSERHLGAPLLKLAKGERDLTEAEWMPLMRALGMTAAFFGADEVKEIPGMLSPCLCLVQSTLAHDAVLLNMCYAVADHLPLFDADGDYFSPYGALRGFHWRGKDCDDTNKDVYPGRATTSAGPNVDHVLSCLALTDSHDAASPKYSYLHGFVGLQNCNGIVGTDSQGRSYEDLFCKGVRRALNSSTLLYSQPLCCFFLLLLCAACVQTGQRGIVNLGDSVTAHFRIPDYYFRPAYINASTYDNLVAVAEDEADWPHCSWCVRVLCSVDWLCTSCRG